MLIDRSGADLIDKRPIFYAPGLTLLTTPPPSRRAERGETLVAFANPQSEGAGVTHMRSLFRGARLGALPDAEVEGARIAQLYRKDRAETFVGSAARESTFKRTAPSARIVHVASHGVIDDHALLYSPLLLAPGGAGNDDGLLARTKARARNRPRKHWRRRIARSSRPATPSPPRSCPNATAPGKLSTASSTS